MYMYTVDSFFVCYFQFFLAGSTVPLVSVNSSFQKSIKPYLPYQKTVYNFHRYFISHLDLSS